MSQTHGAAIETSGLVKLFGATRAVDGVDLVVPRSCVYGLLGPNGAGKTTLIRMLGTLIRPDGGSARVFGHDVVAEADAVRRLVGLTGQFATVDEDLTARENLVLLARLLGHSRRGARARAGELLDLFDLTIAETRLVRTLSGGQRRRLDIAASLVAPVSLLFLDEPTTGLDPRARFRVWQTVRELAAAGTTVMLTTQYLDEADQLADTMVVLDQGRVIAEGSSGHLKAAIGGGVLRLRVLDPAQRSQAGSLLTRVLDLPAHLDDDPLGVSARLADGPSTSPGGAAVSRVLRALADADIPVTDLAFGQPSLDEVFLALTGDRSVDPRPDAGVGLQEVGR